MKSPTSDLTGGELRKFSRRLFGSKLILALVVLVLATVGISLAYTQGSIFSASTFHRTTVHFTIVESSSGPLEGMNGSYYHKPPWPVIQVGQGERVVIDVVNQASSEAHGFAIAHYFPAGATIHPGQSYTVTFIADTKGNFTIFCNIFCSIHPYMEDGLLSVS